MKKIITLLFILAIVTLTPFLVQAQLNIDTSGFSNAPVTGQSVSVSGSGLTACKVLSYAGFAGVVECAIGFFDIIIYLLMTAAFVYVVYGAFTMITNEEKREEAKKTIMYGVIGLFVMVSIWGFVNILQGTFSGLDQGPIDPPSLIRKGR